MKRRAFTAAAFAVAALAAVASLAGAGSAAVQRSEALSCNSTLSVAMLGPFTGDASFIGNEQLSWAKYGVKTISKELGLKIKLLPQDTQLNPSIAATVAQKVVGNANVVGVLGPAGSQEVQATSATFGGASLAHITASATRTALTKTSEPQATRAFFRIIPDDSIQGPSDAAFMIEKLKAKKVVIIDDQESYSTGLAAAAGGYLKRKGVTVINESVPQSQTDFSSLVTKIPSDTDVVFLPWQLAPRAQTFGQQMLEQGKKAKLVGSDGTNAPGVFKITGAYVSNFAGDISLLPKNKARIAGWKKDNPKATLGSFGPPNFGSAQVLLTAIKKACLRGNGKITRKMVLNQVRNVVIKDWILSAIPFRFSTKTNDPLNGRFYLFQIQSDGTYKPIAS